MSVNAVNSDGSLLRVAGGTLYADAPIGTISPFGGSVVPSGYLLCNGQAVSRTTYAALFAAIGVAFGSGDGSTTFNVPDLREATTKGVGLSGKSNNHMDEDGLALGEFLDDRVQKHHHSLPCLNSTSGTTYGVIKGNWLQDDASSYFNTDGRYGDTTEVKAVGVNYIIKAEHTPVPADFMDAVEEVVEDAAVDVVENGNMKAVTSNAVYDAINTVTNGTINYTNTNGKTTVRWVKSGRTIIYNIHAFDITTGGDVASWSISLPQEIRPIYIAEGMKTALTWSGKFAGEAYMADGGSIVFDVHGDFTSASAQIVAFV